MATQERIRAISLILTADCNLSCRYCYQNAKKKKTMPWASLKASIELILASRSDEVQIDFLGGEPLLEFPMIRKAVEYVKKKRPLGKRVKYLIITNGTLLTEDIIVFLESHAFETQISFDGVAEAQEIRGKGTFDLLDSLFERLLQKHAEFLHRNVTLRLTLTPATIALLPGSIDYLLAKGVPNIAIGTSISAVQDWKIERIDELDSTFGRVFDSSLRHWRKTGKIPMFVFRDEYADRLHAPRRRPMCGLAQWKNLTVDVDGEAYGCPVLACSYQKIDSHGLAGRWAAMRMGSIHDPRFAERHAAFPQVTRLTRMFDHKENKYSSYGRCGDCRYFHLCSVCPGSIAHVPGNKDPDRVSDFCCAFNLISLKHRERFPGRREPMDLRSGPAGAEALMEKWRKMAKAAKSRGLSAGQLPDDGKTNFT
jgi:sulfatase maturation enzyme AslB (radical SAM superfamily)